MKNKYTGVFTAAFWILILSVFIVSCSGNSNEISPTREEGTNLETTEVVQPSTEPNPSPEPRTDPSPSFEPDPTTEPTIEPSPTIEVSGAKETTLDGKTLLDTRCVECHNLSRVTSKSKTLEEWRTSVERMVAKGANLSSEEIEVLIQYLAETYP